MYPTAKDLCNLRLALFLWSPLWLVLPLSKPKVADRMPSNLILALLLCVTAHIVLLLELV